MFSPLPLTKSVIYATKVRKDHQQFCWRKSKLIWNVRADVGKATPPFPTSVYHPASIGNTRPISHMWPMRSFLVAQTYPSSPPALPTLRNSCYAILGSPLEIPKWRNRLIKKSCHTQHLLHQQIWLLRTLNW